MLVAPGVAGTAGLDELALVFERVEDGGPPVGVLLDEVAEAGHVALGGLDEDDGGLLGERRGGDEEGDEGEQKAVHEGWG